MITESYHYPLRPRITIKTIDGEDTLYEFNGFDSSHDINVEGCSMEHGMGENGTFSIIINDHNNEIPKDNIHHVKTFLELGKTEADLQHFMIGYGDIFEIDRAGTNAQSYILNGFGSRLWAYQLYINRKETYRKTESDAKIYNIVDNAFTKRLWRPHKTFDRSIQDITGWSRDGISNKVNTVYTRINESYTRFGDLLDNLCDITGAVWFVDYSTGEEILTLTHNPQLTTPVIIKSGDLQDRDNDNPLTASYIVGQFTVEDNTTLESGTANRLITVSVQDEQLVFEIQPTVGSNKLNNKALAQQIIIDNDARRITSMVLSLSKDGEPESPNSRVNGRLVLDNGSNKPGNDVLDEFKIPLSSIKHNPEKIKVELDVSAKKLDVAQSIIWVELFQRSGLTGDPTDDPDNAVKWHHNGIFNTAQAYYSGSAAGGDTDDADELNWQTTNQGPLYRVELYSDLKRLYSRTNSRAARTTRLRELFVPTDFLTDPGEVARYLSLRLSLSSKGRRGIANLKLTVPDSFLYRPYQFVSFNDGLSDLSEMLQVQRASYICSAASTDDVPLGTLYANVTLGGLYNTLIGSCQCV